ncbi:MAG: YbgC/FadM family acyl-CoA thioesterase [Pseudomonadota bacterium]
MDKPAFQWPIRVYWEDTDAGGIVFYANYLKFFERSRTEWLRSLGIEQQRLKESEGGMFIVSDTSVRYLRPARLDDELLVTSTLQELGRASITIVQQALLKSPDREFPAGPPQGKLAPSGGSVLHEMKSVGAVLCEGTIRIGWVSATSLQPTRIPASIINSLKN